MALKDGRFYASFRNARARAIAPTFVENSPNCYNTRSPERTANNLVTLTAAGVNVAVNLFIVTGLVRLNDTVGIFEDVTNVADIEDVYLDIYDGTIATPITLDDAVVCDGANLNSALVKVDDSTGKIVFMNADQVRKEETTKNSNLDPVLINAKNGVTTYVRMIYTNTDTNLNCQIRWYVDWRSFCGSGGELVAV